MAILINHHGDDWNQELYDQARERLIPDPSNPPAGMIAHYAGPGQKGWNVSEIWESEAQWERFRDEELIPAMQEMDGPPFDTDVGELHYKIVTERVTA